MDIQKTDLYHEAQQYRNQANFDAWEETLTDAQIDAIEDKFWWLNRDDAIEAAFNEMVNNG